jgi:toxin CptA
LTAGVLEWDGISWHWVAAVQAKDDQSELAEPVGQAEQEGMISVRFDGQHCMLVKLDGAVGLSRWLWLERGCAPQRWHDMRRAVYSRPNAPVFSITPH